MKSVLLIVILLFLASCDFQKDENCISGDCINGFGVYEFDNGDKYAGDNKKNEPHGRGTYIWANGDMYIGDWTNGIRHGRGSYTYANGDNYGGQFKNNKMHGQGVFKSADGSIIHDGKWFNDEPVY